MFFRAWKKYETHYSHLLVTRTLESLDLLSSSCVLFGLAPAISLIVASCRNSLNNFISIKVWSNKCCINRHQRNRIQGFIVLCSTRKLAVLSNPVQQNSKWFFVFQVEAQLKLIFLWKFAVQHERSVTTLRRRSRDLAGHCLVQRKVAAVLWLWDALIWISRIRGSAGAKIWISRNRNRDCSGEEYPLFMLHEGGTSVLSDMSRTSSAKFLISLWKILSDCQHFVKTNPAKLLQFSTQCREREP